MLQLSQQNNKTEESTIRKTLLDILACPIDKYYPLELHVFEEKEEIVEGLIVCPKCLRWYPIREEIPEMLPDELREAKDEMPFMKKWKDKIPKRILEEGKPFNLKTKARTTTKKKKN
jgi:uncharacterized protein YbaR (Trm112 family)